MKAPVILVVSERMSTNKKKDRYEDKLVRMGEVSRENLGLRGEKTVELWPEGSSEDRINRSKVLEIYQAYSGDLKKVKESMPPDEYARVGFVTSRTFDYICKDKRKKKEDIWVADTIEDTVIGADPEFMLLDSEGILKYAAEIDGFGRYDTLGSDGPLAEIRPAPSIEVVDFVKNIRDILENHENVSLIQNLEWIGGCYYEPPNANYRSHSIGGHVHIGTPGKLAKAIDRLGNLYRISVYSCLNKVLDEYISIPLIRLDGLETSVKRRSKYGYYGDFRTDHGRLEYRALSGEWITHPRLAEIVMGATKAVTHAFFKLLDESDYKHSMIMTSKQQSSTYDSDFLFYDSSFCYWKNIEIMKALDAMKNSSEMRTILLEGKISFKTGFFTALKNKFRSLSTYRKYSEYIDAFLELIELPEKELSKRNKNLKQTWIEGEEFII